MFSTPGGEAGFRCLLQVVMSSYFQFARDMESNCRVTSEMSLAVHGDLGKSEMTPFFLTDIFAGHIFRRESSADELSSRTRHEQPTLQVVCNRQFHIRPNKRF